MRTRWGQAKPLSKCVVLSVFAHILLFGYAYGTKLILDHPAPIYEEVVDLTLVADEDDLERGARAGRWRPALGAIGCVQRDGAATRRVASSADFEPAPRTKRTGGGGRLGRGAACRSVGGCRAGSACRRAARRWLPESRAGPGADPVAIEAPPPSRPSEADIDTQSSLTAPPLRRPDPAAIVQTPPRRPTTADLPSEVSDIIDPGSRLQRLVDVTSQWESAEAVADRRDSLAQAANDGANAERRPSADPEEQRVNVQQQLARVDRRATGSEMGRSGSQKPGRHKRRPPRPPLRPRHGPATENRSPTILCSRKRQDRDEVMKQYGGNGRTQSAVEAALVWLARQQASDGRWDASANGGGHETVVYGHDREGAGRGGRHRHHRPGPVGFSGRRANAPGRTVPAERPTRAWNTCCGIKARTAIWPARPGYSLACTATAWPRWR